jgi:hypothetical protein
LIYIALLLEKLEKTAKKRFPAKMADKYLWSISEVEAGLGVSRPTIRKRLIEKGIQAVKVRGNSPLYRLSEVGPALFSSSYQVDKGAQDPDKMEPLARKAWFDSENARLNFQINEQQLLPAHESARAMAELVKCLVNPLDSLPDILERKAALTPKQVGLVIKIVDSIRDQMYLKVANAGGEIQDDEQ